MNKKYQCLNGFVLKMIAIVTMLIDHMGAILYPQAEFLRVIGRIAFPLFIFLMVEGFFHTRNIRKYELRMLIFALISEIPFDLAFRGSVLEFTYQNVFFTLLLGLIMLDVTETLRRRFPSAVIGEIAVLILFMLAAYLLQTDYDAGGILLIYLFFRLRGRPLWLAVSLFAVSYVFFGLVECPAVIAMIPIFLYNGKRGFVKDGVSGGGKKSPGAMAVQYAFYLFYPVHLLILDGIYMARGMV